MPTKHRVPPTAVLEQDETGVWCATVPALPGCVSQGATKAEAQRKLREAIELHLEALGEDVENGLPADVEPVRVQVVV